MITAASPSMLRTAIALGPPHHALANFDDFPKADHGNAASAASDKQDSCRPPDFLCADSTLAPIA